MASVPPVIRDDTHHLFILLPGRGRLLLQLTDHFEERLPHLRIIASEDENGEADGNREKQDLQAGNTECLFMSRHSTILS